MSIHPAILGSSCTFHPDAEIAPACAAKLSVDEVLQRFEREAQIGVCPTPRYRLPYYQWGRGPALVFIPGLCDDALSFALPIARLSASFRCIAYDLPTGVTDGAHLAQYQHAEFVADLFALMDHLRIDQAVLFGSSFGSTIALTALAQRPERFSRAILQGGFARRPLSAAERLLARFARYWPWPMANLPLRMELLQREHAGCFPPEVPANWSYYLQRSGAPPMQAVARRALILDQTDLRPLLPTIRRHVLLVCGDRDGLVGKECEQELLAGLPSVARAELENCGHVPQFSHPEVLAELVGQYLNNGV